MLDNYVTTSTSRVKSDKNVPRGKFEELKKTAKKKLSSKAFHSKANLNGVTIEFNGNSHHQYEFWKMNWFEGMKPSVDGRIFSAFGVGVLSLLLTIVRKRMSRSSSTPNTMDSARAGHWEWPRRS